MKRLSIIVLLFSTMFLTTSAGNKEETKSKKLVFVPLETRTVCGYGSTQAAVDDMYEWMMSQPSNFQEESYGIDYIGGVACYYVNYRMLPPI